MSPPVPETTPATTTTTDSTPLTISEILTESIPLTISNILTESIHRRPPPGPVKYRPIDLLNHTDTFPSPILHPHQHAQALKSLTRFTHNGHLLGYITPLVLTQLLDPSITPTYFTHDPHTNSITLNGLTPAERTKNISHVLHTWRQQRTFKLLKGWRDELYEVHNPTPSSPEDKLLFLMERSATPLFGVRQSGVHMTMFYRSPKFPGGYAIWVPQRSLTKQTYPGKLDNTVAGGISTGYGPLETLVKECYEEAGLEEQFVRRHVRCTGAISYVLLRGGEAGGETGLVQPGNQICYDLDLTGVEEEVVPKGMDGEVEGFALLDLEWVRWCMAMGWFKMNSACVLMDFMIRHGIMTPENEPDYFEILVRLHRSLEMPGANHYVGPRQ